MEDNDILDTSGGDTSGGEGSDIAGSDPSDPSGSPQLRPQSLMLAFFGNHVLDAGALGVYSGSIIDVLGRVGVGEQAVRSTLTRMVNRGCCGVSGRAAGCTSA